MSPLCLNIPQILVLCTSTSCESLCYLPPTAQWYSSGGDWEIQLSMGSKIHVLVVVWCYVHIMSFVLLKMIAFALCWKKSKKGTSDLSQCDPWEYGSWFSWLTWLVLVSHESGSIPRESVGFTDIQTWRRQKWCRAILVASQELFLQV